MVLRMLRVAVPGESDAAEAAGALAAGSAAGTGSAAGGREAEALALLQAVGGFQAYRRAARQSLELRGVVRFLLYEGMYPGSVASSLLALQRALETADAAPRSSPPVLRLGRLIADLELQRRTPETGRTLGEMLGRVQDELELVDHDIDERYFALAALAAVHV